LNVGEATNHSRSRLHLMVIATSTIMFRIVNLGKSDHR
jgi:hypothetical protein